MMLAVSFIMDGISVADKANDDKGCVNINQAKVKEMSSLLGIGKKKGGRDRERYP